MLAKRAVLDAWQPCQQEIAVQNLRSVISGFLLPKCVDSGLFTSTNTIKLAVL
jgi:hypothetical protein